MAPAMTPGSLGVNDAADPNVGVCLAGDTPGPHVKALTEALDDADPRVRVRAANALGANQKLNIGLPDPDKNQGSIFKQRSFPKGVFDEKPDNWSVFDMEW